MYCTIYHTMYNALLLYVNNNAPHTALCTVLCMPYAHAWLGDGAAAYSWVGPELRFGLRLEGNYPAAAKWEAGSQEMNLFSWIK